MNLKNVGKIHERDIHEMQTCCAINRRQIQSRCLEQTHQTQKWVKPNYD